MRIMNPFRELESLGSPVGPAPVRQDFLAEFRKRSQRYRTHFALWALCSFAVTVFGILVEFEPRPGLAIGLFWGILIGVHTVRHRGWIVDHRLEILAAQGRLNAALLEEAHLETAERLGLDVPSRPAESWFERAARLELGVKGPRQVTAAPAAAPANALNSRAADPLLTRCEDAAVKTRERLDGLGPGEVEALAVVEEGLERVRELLGRKRDIAAAIAEAAPQSVEEERHRLEAKIQAITDEDASALYTSQLELLEARADKIAALRALEERIVAYAESYLAALTSLRMDALRLKSADLSPNFEPAKLLNPVKQLERQVEGMRAAAREVARVVQQAS